MKHHVNEYTTFQSSLREVYELAEAYAPFPSFDDMAWYALAYTRVHELYQLEGFLRVAKDIFHWCWTKGWDRYSDCGGIWFDQNQGVSKFNFLLFLFPTEIYSIGKIDH